MNIQTVPAPKEIEKALGLNGAHRRRVWLRRALWLLVALALLAGGFWWYQHRQSAQSAVSYTAQPAQRTDLVVQVQATGNIQPTTQVDVSSEMSGVIRVVNVDNNSLVKEGDILAELDTLKSQAQLERTKASLASAEARVATAQATVEEMNVALARTQALRDKGVSSNQVFDTAKAAADRASAALNEAKADVAVAEADVKLQQTDLDKSRILSPVDGIVLKRSAEPGQTVASSLQAPVLFTLAEDLRRMQVEANVDEADIGSVKTGQKATFTVDAYPGRAFPAEIQTIEFSPQTTDNVVTYKAVLTVDNQDLSLRPGMTATANITVQDIPDALTVPNAALRYQPPQADKAQGFSITSIFMPRMPRFEKSANKPIANGERTLYVLSGGKPKAVSVKTGATNGQLTEIVSGDLKEGDQVIVSSKSGGS